MIRTARPAGPRRGAPRGTEGGFTLIELMIVIAIIAIIAAIAIPNLLAAKLSANETAAIATLRSLVSAQAQIGVAGKIDCDSDGRGEYGTMMEMTGSIGTRRGYNPGPPATSDFSAFGPFLNPPVLSSVMARIDNLGFATKSGYAFMIFLPDNNDPSLFCHETGPTTSPNLSARIEVDLAETYWCAYAQPVSRGNSGNRRFFTSMRGDVVQSANDVAKAHGTTAVVQGNSAFLGDGITSLPATGTAGKDGDVWKVTN